MTKRSHNTFSDKFVEARARIAGWHEHRQLDRTKIIDQVRTEGYKVLDNVIDFMVVFDKIVILFENKKNGLKEDDIRFDFEHATHLEVPERINNNYAIRIQKSLIPIGSAYRDHLVLLMADDNSVYGGYDTYLCKIGDSGTDAIEAMILDRNFTEIE